MITSSLSNFLDTEGELSIVGNNSPFVLENSQHIWFVKSGNVDVFSIRREGTEVVGARTYLFSVKENEILIGMNLEEGASHRCFLAVGNAHTQVIKISRNKIRSYVSNSNEYVAFSHLIDTWLLSVTSGIARDCSLRYDLAFENSLQKKIPEHTIIRAKKGVLWCSIDSGSVSMLDSETLEFEGKKYFPLTDNAWLMTVKPFETDLISTLECLRMVDNAPHPPEEAGQHSLFWEYVDYYHTQLLELEEFNIRMLRVDDFVRNQEKISKKNRIDNEAFQNIISILDESVPVAEELRSGNSLFEACKFLCDHIGIAIVEPPIDKDKKQPNLNDISYASKFAFRQLTLQTGWSEKDSGALLGYTHDTKNPVVLLPAISGRYQIIIPAENIDAALTNEHVSRIETTAYAFYKPFPLKKITPFELLKFVYQSCKKEIAYLAAAGTIGGILSLFVPLVTGTIIDSVIPQSNRMKLYGFGLSLVFATFALVFAHIIRGLSYLRLDNKIDYVVQSALWDRLIHFPISFFKSYSSGVLASKANSIALFKQVLSFTVLNTVIYNFFLVFNLFLLFYYDVVLGTLTSIFFVLYIAIVVLLGTRIKNANYNVIQYDNSITSLVNQVLNSISKIKIAGVENLAFKLWTDKYVEKQKENKKVRNVSNVILILNSIFPLLATVGIFYLFTLGRFSNFSVGMLLSFLTAFNVFLLSIMQISNASVTFFMAIPLFDNAKEILNSLPEYSTAKESIKNIKGKIDIDHAYFRYNKDGDYILSDISLSIKPGEFVAVVGASGSGKSTLIRLLLGFEVSEMGSIYFDNRNIDSIDTSSLRRQIGTVIQNSRLFPGNIYSNIAGVSNFSVKYVTDVCKIVGLSDDLNTMPMGLFTVVNEGLSTLSGGQRQKILLAKALIMKPSVLFFDEATSALDNESQNILSEYFSKIQATRVVVAHRLSTIRDADKILVMEKGKIVELGNYEELMNASGIFADLVKRQLNKN